MQMLRNRIFYIENKEKKVRNMKSTILDYKELVNSYVNATDWRVKENSTVTYSVGGLILNNSGAITQTTGYLKFMILKLPTPTKAVICISMI